MKKIVCSLFLAVLTLGFTLAIEVDEPELRSTGEDSVQFQNYTGPYAIIETADAITNIGTELGLPVAQDITEARTVHPGAKYTLVHSVHPEIPEGLDADILFLNQTAGVDHIRNLRRIISGFLQAAYGYERSDAETIATFVTIYNAVYRNNLPYFAEKYKPTVVDMLDQDSVGLSTQWEEWAGNTQIVIPLSDLDSEISVVDTSVISDEQVVQAIRQEEGRGVELRETLTEIKEREVQSATERAQEAQRTATQERAAAATATTPEERAIATAQAEQAAQVANEQQQIADRKQQEVRAERSEIAKDKQALLRQPPQETHRLTGLFGANDKTGLYTLVMLDSETGKIVRPSAVQIRGKTVYTVLDVPLSLQDGSRKTFDELYIAICGTNDGHSAIKLCLIDTEKLEVQAQSAENLSEQAELFLYNDFFYTIIQDGTSTFVAAYNKDLSLQAKSSVPVKATTPLTFTEQGLLTTELNGRPRLLHTQTLETIW